MKMTSKRTSILKRLTLGVFTAGLAAGAALVALEGGLRLADVPQSFSATMELDPELGYRPASATSVTYETAGLRHTVSFDAIGLTDAAGAPDARPVAILGDGVVAGWEVDPQERLARQLVDQTQCEAAVNLAVPGYGLLQALLLLERNLEDGLRPRKVVHVVNLGNDLIDNMRNWEGGRIPSAEVTDDGHLTVSPPPSVAPWKDALRHLIVDLRLFALLDVVRGGGEAHGPVMPRQQAWLYAEAPPEELRSGLEAHRALDNRLSDLAERYGFDVETVLWVDWAVVDGKDRVASVSRAVERMRDVTHRPLTVLDAGRPAPSEDAEWEAATLVPGTRHANAETLARLAVLVGCEPPSRGS
ncbi:hypothetical protein [Caenispirillum salinarum]|uniref:hypothetical protein n=1 Tax=Caenispirillum salinarum TaxID=859058 RepID=UPI00384CEF78